MDDDRLVEHFERGRNRILDLLVASVHRERLDLQRRHERARKEDIEDLL